MFITRCSQIRSNFTQSCSDFPIQDVAVHISSSSHYLFKRSIISKKFLTLSEANTIYSLLLGYRWPLCASRLIVWRVTWCFSTHWFYIYVLVLRLTFYKTKLSWVKQKYVIYLLIFFCVFQHSGAAPSCDTVYMSGVAVMQTVPVRREGAIIL